MKNFFKTLDEIVDFVPESGIVDSITLHALLLPEVVCRAYIELFYAMMVYCLSPYPVWKRKQIIMGWVQFSWREIVLSWIAARKACLMARRRNKRKTSHIEYVVFDGVVQVMSHVQMLSKQ